MNWLLNFLFPCPHSDLTFPITPTRCGKPVGPCYVCCLRCGREWEYSMEAMRRGQEIGKRATHTTTERLA